MFDNQKTLMNTPADDEIRDRVFRVAADELRQLIERIEKLEQVKKDASDTMREVYAEAKARGYDARVMRKVVAMRKRDRDDLAEEEAVLEMYRDALGM